MQTVLVPVILDAPQPGVIAQAATILQRGELVAFPTETVYGLGANALDRAAVQRIFTAKGRPANNPLIVHVADAAAALSLVVDWPAAATRLAERFWPGPLTLVLPRAAVVPDVVTGGGPTVALRVPAHPVALALLRAADLPLAAPSANPSSQVSPTRAEHVLAGLGGRIEMILDGGPTAGGLESTVLDLTTTPPRLLRPGLVTPEELEEVIGPVLRAAAASAGEALPSPGMLRRHYAPRVPLELVADSSGERVEVLLGQGMSVGWLTFAPTRDRPGLTAVVMPRDAAAYAASLYDVLHRLVAAGVERIVVDAPPEGDAWLAVRDRLQRAAAPIY